ncbi:MAG: ATP-binding protein [Proteobacteria bacterium]|nr:ATP-binding protein [Pseudomonadota bacterium]
MRSLTTLVYKLRWALLVSAVLLALLAVSKIIDWRSEEDSFASNILVFFLVNLNIMALLVLIVMVGRNVVKLIFERRRGILGAKLRSRLMGAFVLIACIPMVLSFIVASGLINEAMEGWFSTQIESAVTSSMTIARQYVSGVKVSVKAAAERVKIDLVNRATNADSLSGLRGHLENLRNLNDLYAIKILSKSGESLLESVHPAAAVESFAEPPLDQEALRNAARGEDSLRIEELGASQFVRYYTQLRSHIMVISFRMDPDIVHAQGVVNDSFNEYEQLKSFKHPLKSNFFLTLGLFNLTTLFGAIWVAFFVSKQITGPIQRLAEGTRSVARGNYDFELKPTRDDEIGFLVNSFNQMLRDLRSSRDEAEHRGVLIETILANLAVGVVALDNQKRVTTVNSAAGALLQVDHINFVPGAPLSELLRPQDLANIAPLLKALAPDNGKSSTSIAEVETRIESGGRELIVVATAGRIISGEGAHLGYVLLLDDVTELSRSQHLAAWRDVARRIAHEIKNPLTPLQLSAQRLEKLMKGSEHASSVEESTRSIVEHVEIIKRLANEFSEYGRMPTAQFIPTDLTTLLTNTVQSFTAEHQDLTFGLTVEEKIPEMLLDPEQIRGVFRNILNNAVAAIRSYNVSKSGEVLAKLNFDRKTMRAVIEFADNGPGVPASDKNRIFEPYFTTKKGGTGLGLAIVSTVISDHQGEVRVFDKQPHGTRIVITLPQYPQHTTIRKITGISHEV